MNSPRLETLQTQPEAAGFLASLVKGARVTSLLFAGPEGTGKRTHALGFLKSLFCRNGPGCPGCSDCRQLDSKMHPDLLWVQKGFFWPEEEEKRKSDEITGGVVSAVTEKLSLAPLNAPLKVVVVPDAHRMNVSAQDKFLKTLEEPPRRGMIILMTDQPGSLLPTIQSRCRLVRFKPLAPSTAESVLLGRGIDPGAARAAVRFAGGNLTRAFLYTDPDWRAFLEKAPVDFDRGLDGAEGEWMKVVDEYDRLDPGFWDEEELSATQRKARVAEEFLRAVLASWDIPTRERGVPRGGDSVLARDAVRRHLDLLSTHLSPKMVLDHMFLVLRNPAVLGEGGMDLGFLR